MQSWEITYAPVANGTLNTQACIYNEMPVVLSCEHHPEHGKHLVLEVDYSVHKNNPDKGLILLKAVAAAMQDKGYKRIGYASKPGMEEDLSSWQQKLTLPLPSIPQMKVQNDFQQSFASAVSILKNGLAIDLIDAIGKALDDFEGKELTTELRASIGRAMLQGTKNVNNQYKDRLSMQKSIMDPHALHSIVLNKLRHLDEPVLTKDVKNSITAAIVRTIMQSDAHPLARH